MGRSRYKIKHIKKNHSAIDALYHFPPEPDKQVFPKYYQASPQFFTLLPGDCLSLPANWWHWVFSDAGEAETEEDNAQQNIAINYWYQGESPDKPELLAQKYQYWPALQKWNLDFLASIFTEETYISAAMSNIPNLSPVQRQHPASERDVHIYRAKYLSEYQQLIKAWPEYHHQAISSFNQCQNIFTDIALPELEMSAVNWREGGRTISSSDSIPPYVLDRSNLWINWNTGQSGLHVDAYPNFLVQIRGRKRLVVFAPEESQYLYPQAMQTIRASSMKALLARAGKA